MYTPVDICKTHIHTHFLLSHTHTHTVTLSLSLSLPTDFLHMYMDIIYKVLYGYIASMAESVGESNHDDNNTESVNMFTGVREIEREEEFVKLSQ
jgi:hypothetical protein